MSASPLPLARRTLTDSISPLAQQTLHHGCQGKLNNTPPKLATAIDMYTQVGINGFGRIGRIVFRNA